MARLSAWKCWYALMLMLATSAIALSAQSFKTLVSFDGTNGANPNYGSLVQGFDGNIYGTTSVGGASEDGTVFKMSRRGTLTTLHSFDGTDGYNLFGDPVIQAADGNFYGTTEAGGAHGNGTVYKMTPAGVVTTLYSFCTGVNCADGYYPRGLMQASNGRFYGATVQGGAYGGGTVFEIDKLGNLNTLHSFCSEANCADGGEPFIPVQATNGNFYSTTNYGGAYNGGTVFEISAAGKLTTLHSFDGPDGSGPFGGLVQASDGNFYGTTIYGGTNEDGTVFKVTPSGVLTTLHSFDGADGANPTAAVVQATNGRFYGVTTSGGTYKTGTIYEMTGQGQLTSLYSFCAQQGCPDGSTPYAGLLQATDGNLYGTTATGGADVIYGTVFSLDVGLGPFVSFEFPVGPVGKTVEILGQGFTGATGASFNGTSANFKVVSDTFLEAQVPAGATTGLVTVTTPSGTLTSNKPFRVTPQLLSFSPPSGPVGTEVMITGVSLTQTLGVGFGNHVPAQFTVNSDTQVTATVPTGAQSGKIGIQTKGGTAISSGTFTVTP